MPKNCPKKYGFVFKRREIYLFPKLRVKKKKNLFLTHCGIPLKNMLPIRFTLPNAFGFRKPNAGFVFHFYRKAIEIYIVCKFGKSLESIKLSSEKNYLFVYSPWFGYFSWITESLPRIYSTEKEHDKLTLILPESYSNKSFVMESLKVFPQLSIEIISEGKHMDIPKVTIPELKPFTYVFDPNLMIEFREKMCSYVENLNLEIKVYEKLYVSRKKAKNRKITNELEVTEKFMEYGYKEVLFEEYTFFEQVYLMKHCKVLAGVHGAGFANLAFMSENSTLFELIKEYSSYKEERPSYWRLSSALNINYYVQYCEPKEYGNYDLWVGVDLKVNTELLKSNLNKINHD